MFRIDRGSIESHYDSNGFLHVDGLAAKVGVLTYMNADGTTRKELVTPEVLFNSDSIASIAGVPITIGHPPTGLINPSNYQKYSSGSVKVANRKGNSLQVNISVNNADAIESIKTGKKELSCGYEVELEFKPGIYNGQHYDAIQKKRIYNHLALVNGGRAGSECRLNLDAAQQIEETKGKIMAEIKMPSGLTVNVDDAAAASAIQSEFNILQTNLDASASLADEQKGDISKLQANIDAKDEVIKSRNDADLITPLITLIAKCKRFDADFNHMDNDTVMSEPEMMRTSLTKLGVNIDEKDDAYIAARFDIELEKLDADKIAKQRDVHVDSSEAIVSPRQKFMAAQQAGKK